MKSSLGDGSCGWYLIAEMRLPCRLCAEGGSGTGTGREPAVSNLSNLAAPSRRPIGAVPAEATCSGKRSAARSGRPKTSPGSDQLDPRIESSPLLSPEGLPEDGPRQRSWKIADGSAASRRNRASGGWPLRRSCPSLGGFSTHPHVGLDDFHISSHTFPLS